MLLKRFPRRSLTIRQWSWLLVFACILPATLATTFLIHASYKRERASVERGAIEISRALMQAIDRELSSAQGVLEALQASPYLTDGNLKAFYERAIDVTSRRPGNNLVVSDAEGRQLLNTLERFGDPLPMHGNPQQIRRVFETGKPQVSDLYPGPRKLHLLTSVDVPVVRQGRTVYALSMQFFSSRLGNLLLEQRIPEGWVVALLDSSGIVVARTRDPGRFVGQPATPGILRATAEMTEGSIHDHTLEGVPAVAVFSRSSVSRWTIVIGMHQDTLIQPLRTDLSWVIAGALLLFALGLAVASMISERIAASVRGLVDPALALGHDRPVVIPPLHLREADYVGQALQQASQLLARRTEERDVAERAEHDLLEAKREAQQREAFLSGIFQEAPDAVFLVAADGRIVRANVEAEDLFGAGEARLCTLVIDDLLFDPEGGKLPALRGSLFTLSSRSAIGEMTQLRARRVDGEMFPVDVVASPLHAPQGSLVIVNVRDVTERERSERAMRDSEKRFRSTLEHAPIGIALVSLDGHWSEVNSAACEILGYDKEELLQLTFQDVTHPDDLQPDLDYSQRLLNGEIRSYQLEKRYIRKDGSTVPVLLTGAVLRDDSGTPLHYIAQIQDISERKRAEAELRALSDRLAIATRAGSVAVWDWDLVTNELVWDERMYELYRLSPDKAVGTYDMWRERVHPEDLEEAERNLDQALAGRKDYKSEFRIFWPDGQIRIICAHAIVSRDAADKPVRMTGVNIDMTETRHKERAITDALREKETLLKELYHRVKNNLQVITSLFNLQARTLPEGAARAALTEGAGRVRAMALVHEKLYQSGDLSSIRLDAYVSDLCLQLGRAASAEQRGIVLKTDIAPLQIGLESAVPLGLLLNELISNSLKHGFPDGREGVIMVHADAGEGNAVHLRVSDNGIGFPAGFDPAVSQSLGLKLVAALSRQLGGRFSLETCDGACVSIEFDLNTDNADRSRTGE